MSVVMRYYSSAATAPKVSEEGEEKEAGGGK
jgi:hypothetical protein